MENNLQNIPIDKIRNPRVTLRPVRRELVDYIELVGSIKNHGILQSILVRPLDDGYEVVDGNNRFEAAKEAGLTEIPCQVRDMTDKEVLVVQLQCNAISLETRPFEYARRLQLLMEEGLTLLELSALVDKNPQWIKHQLYLNRLIPEAKGPVERGDLTLGATLALANLPETLQSAFLKDALVMESAPFVSRAKAALRDYKNHLLKEKKEDRESGAVEPTLRSVNVLKREAAKPAKAKTVLKAAEAKTPLDGWNACLAWVFKLDPVSVADRKAGRKELTHEHIASRAEYEKLNRAMIKKFVKPESSLGDYKHGE